MKVYVVQREIPYEGNDVLSIHSTMKNAKEEAKRVATLDCVQERLGLPSIQEDTLPSFLEQDAGESGTYSTRYVFYSYYGMELKD